MCSGGISALRPASRCRGVHGLLLLEDERRCLFSMNLAAARWALQPHLLRRGHAFWLGQNLVRTRHLRLDKVPQHVCVFTQPRPRAVVEAWVRCDAAIPTTYRPI